MTIVWTRMTIKQRQSTGFGEHQFTTDAELQELRKAKITCSDFKGVIDESIKQIVEKDAEINHLRVYAKKYGQHRIGCGLDEDGRTISNPRITLQLLVKKRGTQKTTLSEWQ